MKENQFMEQKIRGVLGASEEKQYRYFINKIVDNLEVWGIFYASENAWASKLNNDNDVLILFPEKEFAEYYINESQCTGVPQKINLLEFLYEWKFALPEHCFVFLYGNDNGKSYTMGNLTADICSALNSY